MIAGTEDSGTAVTAHPRRPSETAQRIIAMQESQDRQCSMVSISDIARRAAKTHCALLMTGETGVGKGRMARWIHEHSPRARKPFVPVNCGGIPDGLIDSQLFGHAKGSFSGATTDHLGLVRAAEGGTLFLDEISELPMTAQTRLLRLLQEREAQPVGYSRPVQVDVRIIAACNGDLRQAVEEGRFREDLYYRLDVIRVPIAPLRERTADIDALIDEFNAEFADMYDQPTVDFEASAMQALRSYDWPGNVRELRTVIERLHVLLGGGTISRNELAELGGIRLSANGDTATDFSLEDARKQIAHRALNEAGGNVTKAASLLGIHRSTVYRWLTPEQLES